MIVSISPAWTDYELLDSGNSQRLERFGPYRLVRPDPQAIWQPRLTTNVWEQVDAHFEKTTTGKEGWIIKTQIPDRWKITYKDLHCWARLTPFKHTGVFPEQAVQWDWLQQKIAGAKRPVHILNLFAYTGMASIACAKAGATVTHVDASKPSITWAKENQIVSGLPDTSIRWILDDAVKFTEREVKRDVTYDGIILDPPVYGHGPNGEVWDFHKHLPLLLKHCRAILTPTPLFFLINAYAISSSALMLENVLQDFLGNLGGQIEVGELALQETDSKRLLSTGIFGRWERGK